MVCYTALSATLPPIDGPVGQHPLVCSLLQGMFNQRPPVPRYQEVWDVALVLKYIEDGPPNSKLTLKELSKQLVTLLALCNASRASDIQALDIQFMRVLESKFVFTIPGLTKTRRSGPPKQVSFLAFNENHALCPVRALKTYKERTVHLRGDKGGNGSRSLLIISYKKPYKPVKSGTISRWIKETLSDAGIDTQIFKGHSTRAASTSAACAKGISMNDIMSMAGWSFERFYHKEMTNDFSQAVLQS